MDPNPRIERINDAIKRGLGADHVEVIDHSADHVGHAGAAAGGGHFELLVVCDQFEGLSRVSAQRLVYTALGNLMTTDIHAVSMHTLTPEQWRARSDRGSR